MTLLQKLRKSKGLTQLQLSKLLEISPEHVSRIENGNRNPSWEVAQRLEQFFGIPASELLAKASSNTRLKNKGGKQ